jgi:hypothetical protein
MNLQKDNSGGERWQEFAHQAPTPNDLNSPTVGFRIPHRLGQATAMRETTTREALEPH